MQLWDTGGQERFASIVHTYFRDADLLVFCYAKDNKASFEAFNTRWQPIIQQACAENPTLLLCGTKSDLPKEAQEVSEAEVEELQRTLTKKKELGKQEEQKEQAEEGWFETVDRLEVSAKTGQGIERATKQDGGIASSIWDVQHSKNLGKLTLAAGFYYFLYHAAEAQLEILKAQVGQDKILQRQPQPIRCLGPCPLDRKQQVLARKHGNEAATIGYLGTKGRITTQDRYRSYTGSHSLSRSRVQSKNNLG